MSRVSFIFERGLPETLNSSWLAAEEFLHLAYLYELFHDTPIPFIPFGITLWSIFFWAMCILVVAPRFFGVVFSIVIFFVARIPGVRLTIGKVSIIDGFQNLKFHYDVPEMNVSVSVDAIKLRPWFYAPGGALIRKPCKFLVGLIERPEIILCIRTGEKNTDTSAANLQKKSSPVQSTPDGFVSKLLKLSMSLLEISVSKLSIKATRDRKNEMLAIDCLKTSILGNFISDTEAPAQSPRRVANLWNFRRPIKANSLFCPEILSENFCCQVQYADFCILPSEQVRSSNSISKVSEIKSPTFASGASPPPAPPPPPINPLLKLLTFSPWKPPLGINFEINSGHTKQDVYSMASELSRRNIPAAFSISSFSLIARGHGNSAEEKSTLKWNLTVSPVCFVCCLDQLQNVSFSTDSSIGTSPSASQQSTPATVRNILEDLPPIFPLSCTLEKVVLCAAFSVTDDDAPDTTSKASSAVSLDALQISFEKAQIICDCAVPPLDDKAGASAIRGQFSVDLTIESMQGSYMSVPDMSLLDIDKFECNTKLKLGQPSLSSGQGFLAAGPKVARARAAGANGLVHRRVRRPSADAGQLAFVMSGAAPSDESATLDVQCACAEFALLVTDSLLLASSNFSRKFLSLVETQTSKTIVLTSDSSKVPNVFSYICIKCQIETISVMLGDFSRHKDAMTEIVWKSWTMRFSDEPGNFTSQSGFVTESSKMTVSFSIGCTPALISHSLHGVFLENSSELFSLQGLKFSSSSSNGNSIELKSITILLSEPVVFDVAMAIKAIFGNTKFYPPSKIVNDADVAHFDSPKTPTPFRLDIKNVNVSIFYDCTSHVARIADSHVGMSTEEVWLSLFHLVCADIYYERTYKPGKSAIHHQFSIGTINSFYMSPEVPTAQGSMHVSAKEFFAETARAHPVLNFNAVKADVTQKMASSLVIVSIHAIGAYEGQECICLNLECITALIFAGSAFKRLLESCNIDFSSPPPRHTSSTPEIWIYVDFEFMNFTFSATPRSKIQASFATLSARRKTGLELQSGSLDGIVAVDDDDDAVPTGPHSAFFESIYEHKAFKAGSSATLAIVASELRVNYLPCVSLERVPFSSFRLGPDVTACENILVIDSVAFTLPSNPASEYEEEKMRSTSHEDVQSTDLNSEEQLVSPPLGAIALQLINVQLSASISPTTSVLGRNILKNKPYGLVDFGMIMDDTLLTIKACQKLFDDGTSSNPSSKKDSDRKFALELFVKQAKLRVKEHRVGVGKDGEAQVNGEGWLWALYCLHQDELVERQKRWVEVEKVIHLQKTKKYTLDDKELRYAFDSENATIWKERVKKLKEKLKQHSHIIPDLCVISIDRCTIGLTSWSHGPLINSMMEKLDDSGAKRSVFQSEWPEFDDVYGGMIFGKVSKFRMQLRAFEMPLMKFEMYQWAGKVVIAEERSHPDILIPCSIAVKHGAPYRITIYRSCLPMKLYHQTQATMSGFCLFYGSAHAQCISMMGAALSSLSPPSPVAIAPLLPFDKLRLMLHGSSAIKFVPVSDGPAIEVLLSISNSPQAFGDAVQFSFDSVILESSLARLSLECRGVSINFLYGEKLIWPILTSNEMNVIVSFDWVCLGSSCKHHFNQIMNQVRAEGGTLRSMLAKGDMLPTFRSAGVRLKLELDTVNTALRLHVDSLGFIFRVLNSLDSVGNSFLQFKSFHTAEGCYFSLRERTKPFGQHILSINIVFKAEPVAIFCFYSGPMPSRQALAPIKRSHVAATSELHHGVFRFATKTFVFKLEQSHVLQPASKYDQRMAVTMVNDDVPRKLEWVINLLEIETKVLSIYDVGFHHNCNGWYGDGNALVKQTSTDPPVTKGRSQPKHSHDPEKDADEHLFFLEYCCRCQEQCALDGRRCDAHQIIATSVGVKLAARAERADGPRSSGESQKSSQSQRSASLSEDTLDGGVLKKAPGSDVRDRTRQWVGGLAVAEAGVKAAASMSSSPLAVLSELLKKPLNAVIKSEDRSFVPPAFISLGPSSPKMRVVDARDTILDILAESLFVQITYENRYAYSVWSNGLRYSLKDEPVKRRNQDGHSQLSESEIKWRRFLDPTDEMIGSSAKSSDARGKLNVPEQWQHCNEFQGTISRTIWRLELKEPQLGIQALPPERQGKHFQCRLQHRLLLTGSTGQILSTAVRFLDKKDKSWKSPRSHISLVMDGIFVRMAEDHNSEEHTLSVSRRSQSHKTKASDIRNLKEAADENTYILIKLWNDVLWVTGDAARNAAQQIVLESPYLKFSFYCDLDAPSSLKQSSSSAKENVYMHSPTHVDLTYGNVVSVFIKEVKIVTDCVQFRVFSEVINGLLRPLPTETEADDNMEALRLNALLDVNQIQRRKKIEMDINTLKRQLDDPLGGTRKEDDLRAELSRLEAQLRTLTQAGQEQLSEQRLRFLSYHLLNCTWEIRAKEQDIDSAFEKGVRGVSHGSPDLMTSFSKIQLEDVFGTVSYATTEPQGFSFRVRSFVVNNQTSDHPRLGEFVFQPKEGLAPSLSDVLSDVRLLQRAANCFISNIMTGASGCQKRILHRVGHTQILGRSGHGRWRSGLELLGSKRRQATAGLIFKGIAPSFV